MKNTHKNMRGALDRFNGMVKDDSLVSPDIVIRYGALMVKNLCSSNSKIDREFSSAIMSRIMRFAKRRSISKDVVRSYFKTPVTF